MYEGTKLWKDIIHFKLEKLRVSDTRTIETYVDVPVNLYASLVASAKKYPQKIAISDDCGHKVTFQEFLCKVDAFESYLKEKLNIKRGDHVAMMMYNSLEFGVAFLSLNKLGAVAIPLQTKYKESEIHSLLDKADPICIISDANFASWFDRFKENGVSLLICKDIHSGYGLEGMVGDLTKSYPNEGQLCDNALLVFTSGTTSQSKGVVIKNYNLMHAILSYEKTLRITQDDVATISVPMYLITGLVALFGLFVHVGGTVYIHKFFNAEQVLDCIKEKKVTFMHASPTVFSMLLAKAADYPNLSSLKKVACGSSNMPKEKIRQFHKWLPQCSFHTVYGLTETTSPGTIFPADAAVSPYIGSSGFPIPGTQFKILQSNGSEASPGKIGEIFICGANILDSYYKTETPLLKDNWLDTGDLGYFNADGYLFIVDRKKDMINRGGEKICSFDVENEMYMIEGILDAAVVGIPDDIYGEVPAAVIKVVPDFSMTESEIQKALKKRLASYKVPVIIKIMDDIPVTSNNKIDKKYIRTLF